tara:strand:+ start:36 stop:656 length:621 start_codon:yes stop_codon:yes gene_type:complete
MGAANTGRQDGPNGSQAMNVNTGQTINESGKVVGSRFINTDIPRNKLFKFTPQLFQSGVKIVENITDAPKKNRAFLINNYERISTNYKLPDRKKFNEMDLDKQQKIYTDMRQDFMRNNKDPFGETLTGGGGYEKPEGIELAKAATGSATILGPAEIQKTAANTTAIKMSAAQTNVANKRKGRKSTNITAKKTLDNNYTLSKKTLLG